MFELNEVLPQILQDPHTHNTRYVQNIGMVTTYSKQVFIEHKFLLFVTTSVYQCQRFFSQCKHLLKDSITVNIKNKTSY